jgi:hypothetical protein
MSAGKWIVALSSTQKTALADMLCMLLKFERESVPPLHTRELLDAVESSMWIPNFEKIIKAENGIPAQPARDAEKA